VLTIVTLAKSPSIQETICITRVRDVETHPDGVKHVGNMLDFHAKMKVQEALLMIIPQKLANSITI